MKQYRFLGLGLGALYVIASSSAFAQAAPDGAAQASSSVSVTTPPANTAANQDANRSNAVVG
ncbi:MAG: hypothetical protein QM784_03945 [Polyangiaceae bacterium]